LLLLLLLLLVLVLLISMFLLTAALLVVLVLLQEGSGVRRLFLERHDGRGTPDQTAARRRQWRRHIAIPLAFVQCGE
jgi:hypothetical protein